MAEALSPKDRMSEVFEAIGYTPTPKQLEFHRATERDVLYGGAAGGGKTAALVADMLAKCVQWPGISIACFRRTYDELAESVIRQLGSFGYAEALGAKWNGSDRDLAFSSGSKIRFRYAENEVDASRRQGGEFQALYLDERTLFRPGVVALLLERLRSGKSTIPVVGVRSASNPGGADHAAIKSRFIDATEHGGRVYTDSNGQTVRFIPSRVDDNPHVDRGYKARLEAIPDPARRAAMLDGDWDQFAGQFFTEWSRERHLMPAFDIPASWLRVAGIDWGYAAPFGCLWLAEDEDGRIYVYRERYGSKLGEKDQARMIVDAEDDSEIVARFADDAMWTSRGDAASVADVYVSQGCFIAPARKGERLSGWQRVHSYLAEAPACMHHRAMGWATCPNLHVFEGRCPNLVRTLPAMSYDAHKPEDLDTKAEDHLADCLRYALLHVGGDMLAMFAQGGDLPADAADPLQAQLAALRDPFSSPGASGLPTWRDLYGLDNPDGWS